MAKTPNKLLMEVMGTGEVYEAKLAGEKPLASRLALPIIGGLLGTAYLASLGSGRSKSIANDSAARSVEANRNSGDIRALMGNQNSGTMQHIMRERAVREGSEPYWDDYPIELLKEGSEIADSIGRLMAKRAGIVGAMKPLISAIPGIGRAGGWKPKALVGGLALGGGYAALKGGQSLYNKAGAPADTKIQGAGPALPRYVNQWGMPTIS